MAVIMGLYKAGFTNGGKIKPCRHAAANKPVVLLPGVNHAQLSNGALREGDLEPEQDAAGATAAAAAVLGDFIAAHMSPERCSAGQAAVQSMCCYCLQSLLKTLLMCTSHIQIRCLPTGAMAPAIWTAEGLHFRECHTLTKLTGISDLQGGQERGCGPAA